jgi:hypothetical protein
VSREGRLHPHLQALASQQLHGRPSMKPPAPVTPEERGRPDHKGVQQHAHLARLRGGSALPLTLLPASDRGGNCGGFPHRPRAGCHRLLCAARGRAGIARPDSGASHQAGQQSHAHRSGQLSRAGPLWLVHTLVQEQVRGQASLSGRGAPEPASVVRTGSGCNRWPSSRRRFHTHWLMMCHASWPQAE